jgi:hypothetical protein
LVTQNSDLTTKARKKWTIRMGVAGCKACYYVGLTPILTCGVI